jgi:hypothetical protein
LFLLVRRLVILNLLLTHCTSKLLLAHCRLLPHHHLLRIFKHLRRRVPLFNVLKQQVALKSLSLDAVLTEVGLEVREVLVEGREELLGFVEGAVTLGVELALDAYFEGVLMGGDNEKGLEICPDIFLLAILVIKRLLNNNGRPRINPLILHHSIGLPLLAQQPTPAFIHPIQNSLLLIFHLVAQLLLDHLGVPVLVHQQAGGQFVQFEVARVREDQLHC